MDSFRTAPSPPAILAELATVLFSAPIFDLDNSSPLIEMEQISVDMLAKALGLPDCFLSDGTFGLGGGAMYPSMPECIIAAMSAARERYLRARMQRLALPEERIVLECQLVVLSSEMAHYSVGEVASLMKVHHRPVPVKQEDNFAMTAESLQEVVSGCQGEGLEVFFIVATIGTTAVGAQDNLGQISLVAEAMSDVWTHIDGTGDAGARVCEEHRDYDSFIKNYDSISVSLQKWLHVQGDVWYASLDSRITTAYPGV